MSTYDKTKQILKGNPKVWLITGVAGFIGSNLLETLLELDQQVVGLDNFSTGHRHNLKDVEQIVGPEKWARFKLVDGDISAPSICNQACQGIDVVLHQAALGSVPRSILDPLGTHQSNVTGFLNLLHAAQQNGVSRFVYASSSSVYGDHPKLPKVENEVGNCLSPYALSKWMDELYAAVFARCYGMRCIGLRYFNVFGPRQDPEGAYAAVIPKWIAALIRGEPVQINGDGETSRDFCYIRNVVQANLLAGTVLNPDALNQVYNIAVGGKTTLNELYELLRSRLEPRFPHLRGLGADYKDFRAGDIRHSTASIDKARRLLGYEPTHTIAQGIAEALDWYIRKQPQPA
jgi:UDP-N-acetylglucosamine 4-epimerase